MILAQASVVGAPEAIATVLTVLLLASRKIPAPLIVVMALIAGILV
ncbi:hypothetical protein [Alkalispirochaeta americana]|nr:hypothetical protein [Alkalispirochaeta americana]